MYFTESSIKLNIGHRFGFLNTRTKEFELLPKLPSPGFGIWFSGCWHCGVVYVVDKSMQLRGFDVANNKWTQCGISLPQARPGVRLLSNPHDTRHIYAMVQGSGLYMIDLVDASVELFTMPPVRYDLLREALLIGCDAERFVLVVALRNGMWYSYKSYTDTWCRLEHWKPTKKKSNRNMVVFSPSARCVYYMVDSFYKWFVVSLS